MSGVTFGDNTMYRMRSRDKMRTNINTGIGLIGTGLMTSGVVYAAKKNPKTYDRIAMFIGKYIEKANKYIPKTVKNFVSDILSKDMFKNIKAKATNILKDKNMLTKAGNLKRVAKGKLGLIGAGIAAAAGLVHSLVSSNIYTKGKIDQSYEDAEKIGQAYAMGQADKGYQIASAMSRAPRKMYF